MAAAEALLRLAGVNVNARSHSGRTALDELDLYRPGRLEELRDKDQIDEEVARLTPKDDMERRTRDARLRAMTGLLEEHNAVSGGSSPN